MASSQNAAAQRPRPLQRVVLPPSQPLALSLACLLAALALLLASPAARGEEPELSEGPVHTGATASDDRRIRSRLVELYDSIASLRGVEVGVTSGVVRLEGVVADAAARETASRLAGRVEGVVAVEDELRLDRSISSRMRAAGHRLSLRAVDLLAQLPLLAVALVLGLLTVAAGRAVVRFRAPFRWLTSNVFLQDLARQGVQLAFGLAAVVVALEILDATAAIGAVVGAAGVAGLAVGFAFRDLVENYLASILLSLRQPFLPNDHVRILGNEGLVVRLTSRATILLTFDGNHVRIPNSEVFKGVIENFSRKPERRFEFPVGVGVDEDLTQARSLGRQALAETPGVLAEPPPLALIEGLGDSTVTLRFFAWVDQREADFGKVRSEAIRLVKAAFDRERIEMPEPIARVRLSSAPEPTVPRETKGAGLPHPAADVSKDDHLDDDVTRERMREDGDLLDEQATRE